MKRVSKKDLLNLYKTYCLKHPPKQKRTSQLLYKKQKLSEYYANGEMTEQDYKTNLAKLSKKYSEFM